MNWSLECNGKHFYNKLEALQEQRSSKSGLYFNTPVAYDKIDFSTQDDSTLDELCKAEAQKIRDTHDKVVIWYSGGSDSHYVLQTFIKNNITVDELILVKSGFATADFEIDDYALPFAESTGIPITIKQPNMDYYHKFYIEQNEQLGTANDFWHHFRLNNHFENLQHHDTNGVAHIFGKEKPKLCYVDGEWYAYILDVEFTHQPYQINFFCDNPLIYRKQCQMVMEQITQHKNIQEYNHVTNYNEHQDFWNRAIGRYTDNLYPVKQLLVSGQFNNKDHLAIQESPDNFVEMWRDRNTQLIKLYGEESFNNGDPAMGTVGVLSKFYGLTQHKIMTVDQLFPNGFVLI